MIDDLIPLISDLEKEGAIIVLKWDGERSKKTKNLLIMRNDTNFIFSTDTSDFTEALLLGINEYEKHHGKLHS